MHQRLKIVQNGRRSEMERAEPLRRGIEGNEQTLRIAAAMVREDSAQDERLRGVASSRVANCAPHDAPCEVSTLFEFVRDQIRYVEDAPDTERIADGWRTLEHMAGDCGDKSILLASLLGTLGYRSRFIVQSWSGDLSEGYDHVHIEVMLPDGSTWELDPTNEHAATGWEARDRGRAMFPIWDEGEGKMPALPARTGMDYQTPDSKLQTHHLGGFFDDFGGDLISSGIQAGSQYATSAAQQSRASSAQTKQIGAAFENLVSQAKQVFQSIAARLPNITADDLNAAAAAYQTVEQFVSQHPIDYDVQQWNSDAYKGQAQRYLAQFQAALQGGGQLSVVGGESSVVSSQSISPWVIAAIAIGFALVMRK